MRILTRYVLREFLIPFGYCLAGFISIYVLFELFGSFSRMMSSEASLQLVLKYLLGYLAPYFHYLVPAALMLATLYTMWSFCRHSEIIAMRASGVSFIAIVKPLLSVSILSALLVAWVNESFVPRYAHWANQLKNERFSIEKIERADNIVYRNSTEHRTWNINRVLDVEGKSLKDVRIAIDRASGARLRNITAAKAEFLDGQWWFYEPKVQHYDVSGQEIATPVPEMDALKFRCFSEFTETPSDFILQNRPWRYNSVRDRFRYIEKHREITKEARNELLYDTWAQIVSPLACIIITLFAIPAGIASGRQSVFKGILGALGMFFAFYGFTIACMIVAKNGWCNAIFAAVIPDLTFLALGIRAFFKQR
jgi:lipopolysaccharide export system permease protein